MTNGEAFELLKSAATYADTRWIPWKERSPEVGIRYLVSIKNDYERRCSKTARFEGDVTVRRSLSEAYMEEKHEP